MNDDSRFFRWVGRINALLFLAGAVTLLALAAGTFWTPRYGAPPDHVQKTEDGDTYDFAGSFDSMAANSSAILRLDGTEEGLMMLRRRSGRYEGSFSSGGPRGMGANVNVLVFDLHTMRNHWMFQGLKQDIAPVLFVRAPGGGTDHAHDPVTALLMPVATADTDGDGKITYADAHSLYLYRLGSAAPVALIKSRIVSGMDQLDAGRVLVTYYDGKSDRAAMLSAKDFSVIAQTEVAATPK